MGPIRVCFVIDRLARAGTESQLLALIRGLDRGCVVPHLCLLDGEDELSRQLEPSDCPVLRLGVRKLLHPRAVARAWRFARFLRKHRIDVVQTYFPDSTYFAAPVARLVGVSRIVRVRNDQGFWMTPLQRLAGRLINPFINRTLVNCADCQAAVLRNERPRAESITVLENGVDVERFAGLSPPGGRPGDVRRVGVVANLRPVKNLDLLLRAVGGLGADFADVQVTIAGEGEQRAELQQLAAELGLADRFHLPGSVRDISAFLGRLDVAVLCSRSEGMSNAVLEYMAAGRAVVSTATGAAVGLLADGRGLLLEPGDVAGMTRALADLLADLGKAARMGHRAREYVTEHHDRGVMVRRYEAFVRDLVGKGAA